MISLVSVSVILSVYSPNISAYETYETTMLSVCVPYFFVFYAVRVVSKESR
jgi:hypothetical protein